MAMVSSRSGMLFPQQRFAGVLICCDVVSRVSSEFVFNESFAQCSIINLYSVKSFIRHTCDDTSLISGVDLINGSRDVL